MPDWEVTATTIYCENVDDEVTLIVTGDGTARCSGRRKYENPKSDVKRALQSKSRSAGKHLQCSGDACPSVKQYHDKMMAEK
jgi:hypothetical protein